GDAAALDRDPQQHAFLDRERTVEEPLERVHHVGGLDGGEVAELPHVDAEDGHAFLGHEVDRAQHRAVATEADGEIEPVREGVVVGGRRRQAGQAGVVLRQAHLVAVVEQPTRRCARQLRGLEPVRVHDEPDRRHQRFLACTRYSTLPSAPVIGEGIVPMMAAPRRSNAPVTSSSTRARTASSRITPFPLAASWRVASNCGLTSTTTSAPGAAHASRAGATTRNEMNDTSATTRSTGPPMASASSDRTLVRSRCSTRGSWTSRSWSCACPT